MTKIRFQEYAPNYKNNLDETGLASNTIRKRKLAVEEFIRYTIENKLTIETDNFYESVDKLREFFEETSIHGTKVSAIRHFIDYIAKQEDTRTADQLEDIKEKISVAKLTDKDNGVDISRRKIEEKLLTDEEIEAAKEKADDKTELVIDLMMDTACRPGELVAMTPEDLDFEQNSFEINETYVDSTGEFQDYPKHESFRTVKISQDAAARLREYIEDNGIASDEYIFPSYRSDVYRPIKKAYTEADVRVEDGSTKVTPHVHRHNACTRLIQNGNSKEKVQEYMGHGSIQITEVYEHFDRSKVVDVELA